MVRALLAEYWIIEPAHGRGKPDPAILVEHAVVVVGALAPDFLVAPIGRGLRRLRHSRGMEERAERFGCVRARGRHLGGRPLVRLRIEDRHIVARGLRANAERSIRTPRTIAACTTESGA